MRTTLGLFVILLAAGCGKEDRDIPFWEDGMLLEGDCETAGDAPEIVTSFLLTQAVDPLIKLEDYSLTIGQVITDEQSYHNMMVALNFSSWLTVDFDTQQVGAIFYDPRDACEIGVEEWNVFAKPGGGVVFDATWTDSAMNCAQSCGIDTQAVLIVATSNKEDLSLCRRVRPGCEPL